MTTYARIETNTAYISTDFGRDYACRVFGLSLPELERIVGRYTKGKRKGELKGLLRWQKVAKGGWVRGHFGGGDGFVVKPNTRYDFEIVDSWTEKVLWSEDFKRFGWIPGETRAQYDQRQAVKREFVKARHTLRTDQAKTLIAKLPLLEVARQHAKRSARNVARYMPITVVELLRKEIVYRPIDELIAV